MVLLRASSFDDRRALFSICGSPFDRHRALFFSLTAPFDGHRALFFIHWPPFDGPGALFSIHASPFEHLSSRLQGVLSDSARIRTAEPHNRPIRVDTGSQIFRFGPFELDSSRQILNRGAEVVWLPDRQMNVLLILASAADLRDGVRAARRFPMPTHRITLSERVAESGQELNCPTSRDVRKSASTT